MALLYHSVVGLIASALFPLLYWLGKHPALLPTFTHPIFSRMTLRNLWCFSQLFFTLDTAAMFMTRSFKGGTVEVTCLGLCWAVTAWIPFALVGEMIHELSDTQPTSPPEQPACENTTPGSPTWSETQSLLKATRPMSGGTILGIHNLAIVIPQFISSLAASVIFKIASAASSDTNQQNSLAGGEGIAYVFLLGSFSSLSAAYLTRRIPPTQSELAFQQSYRT